MNAKKKGTEENMDEQRKGERKNLFFLETDHELEQSQDGDRLATQTAQQTSGLRDHIRNKSAQQTSGLRDKTLFTSDVKCNIDFAERDSKFKTDLNQNILMATYIKPKYRKFFDFCFNNIYIQNPKVVYKEYVEFVRQNLPELYDFKETKTFKKIFERNHDFMAKETNVETIHSFSLSGGIDKKTLSTHTDVYTDVDVDLDVDVPIDLSVELTCDSTSEEENIFFDGLDQDIAKDTLDSCIETFTFGEIENQELERELAESINSDENILQDCDEILEIDILKTNSFIVDTDILWAIYLHGTAMDFYDISDIFIECQRDTNVLLFFHSITLEVYNDIYQQFKDQKKNIKIVTYELTINPFFVLSFHYAGNSISTYRIKLMKAYSTKRLTVCNKKNIDLNFKLLSFLEDLSKHNCGLSKIHYLYSFYYLNDLILDSKKTYYKIFLGFVPKFIVSKNHYSKFEEYERKKMKFKHNYLSSKQDVFNLF